MEKLDAINEMLRMIGTRKVTSIQLAHPDVVDAVDTLDSWTRKTLQRGWWFNRMRSVTLEPTPQGFIQLPQNTLQLALSDPRDKINFPLISKRGTRLIDVTNNTFVFSQSITLDIFITLDWDDIPAAAQNYIMYKAAADLVRDKIEDSAKAMSLEREAQTNMEDLDAQEIRTEGANMFTNPATARVRQGRRPFFNRTIGGYRSGIPRVD